MLLTMFLAIVFCAAITLLLISAVAFIRYDGTNKWFFSSAPKEALELLKLLVIFPAASALAAWICTLFR